ncbi:hypothetical protein BJF78_20095 [Pseudonocardia sp. CNS-139]|nr:hypothetical protein BJF78_20095 [Pseudonocardia sp. CNS-139]
MAVERDHAPSGEEDLPAARELDAGRGDGEAPFQHVRGAERGTERHHVGGRCAGRERRRRPGGQDARVAAGHDRDGAAGRTGGGGGREPAGPAVGQDERRRLRGGGGDGGQGGRVRSGGARALAPGGPHGGAGADGQHCLGAQPDQLGRHAGRVVRSGGRGGRQEQRRAEPFGPPGRGLLRGGVVGRRQHDHRGRGEEGRAGSHREGARVVAASTVVAAAGAVTCAVSGGGGGAGAGSGAAVHPASSAPSVTSDAAIPARPPT